MRTWDDDEDYHRATDLLLEAPAEALKLFERALTRQPDRARIHTNRAKALAELERFEEAVAAARRAADLDDTDGYVLATLLSMLRQAGRVDEATALGEVVLAREDLDAEARLEIALERAWCTIATASPAVALDHTRDLVGRHPDDPMVLLAHSTACAAMCSWDEAFDWIDRALDIDPGNPEILQRRDLMTEARQVARELVETAEGDARDADEDPEAWRFLGLVYARFGRLEEAMAAFERAHSLGPPGEDATSRPALVAEATLRGRLEIGDRSPLQVDF